METEDWTIVHMHRALVAQGATIDALVEALNVARRSMPLNIGASPRVRAAHKVVDAALALARGGK